MEFFFFKRITSSLDTLATKVQFPPMSSENELNPTPAGPKPWIDAGRKRVTAEDVARIAGVSRSAVSRAYTKGAYLSLEKRRRIHDAAEALGYRPNALAAGFNSNRSNLVAIVTGNLNNHYDGVFTAELVTRLNGLGKLPVVIGRTTDNIGDSEILEVLDYPLDALVIRAGSVKAETVEKCLRLQVPVIVSGRILAVGNVDCLCCDNHAGMEMAVAEFARSGRQRIGYLGGHPELSAEQERCAGFVAAMQKRHLKPVVMEHADFSFEGGYTTGTKILQGSDRPDAILCGNDAMALGVMNVARETLGLDVPGDLAIIGFDDIELARWPCFDLSTIRNPIDVTIDGIVSLLESRFADPARHGETIRIAPEFIPRSTH